MVELLENEVHVLNALRDSGGRASLEELARKTQLADAAVARAVLTLSNQDLVEEQVTKRTELACTEEGRGYALKGLPERRVISLFSTPGQRVPIDEALRRAELARHLEPIVTGSLVSKGW